MVDLGFNDKAVTATLVRENEFRNFAWLKAIRDFNENDGNWPSIFDVDAVVNNGQWDKNRDRPGNDYKVRNTETSLECAKLCAADNNCRSMSWDSSGSKRCWLKHSEGGLRDSNARDSWKKNINRQL